MPILTSIGRALATGLKKIGLLPKTWEAAMENRREQVEREKQEAERLDRIRNPDKYLGND